MAFGMQVNLGPGHIVLDGDPAPLPKRGRVPTPIFDPFLSWPNGWMHQDATWYGGRPQPRQLCVRWGHSSPPQKWGGAPQFSAHVYCGQTSWMDQDATWYGGRHLSRRHCVTWGPSSSPQKGCSPSPNFQPMSIVAKRLYVSGYHLVQR